MTEMVTSGSMSGKGKRSDGLLGEGDDESRRLLQAPPVLHVTAPLLDSTVTRPEDRDRLRATVVDDDQRQAGKSLSRVIFVVVGRLR